MAYIKRIVQILGAGSTVLLLAAPALHAADNTGSRSQPGTNGAAIQSSGSSASAAANGAAASNGAARGATISEGDQKMMKDIAEANFAEIRTGKMALEKSKNADIRKFAQMMINDHTKANSELQKLAQSKGVALPQETDIRHKAEATGLNVLSGNTFDKAYINFVGQADHERARQLLQDTMTNAQDSELRAYAKKTLQAVNQHKQQADAIKQRMKSRNQ